MAHPISPVGPVRTHRSLAGGHAARLLLWTGRQAVGRDCLPLPTGVPGAAHYRRRCRRQTGVYSPYFPPDGATTAGTFSSRISLLNAANSVVVSAFSFFNSAFTCVARSS